MSQHTLLVQSSYLATENSLQDRELCSGKIESHALPDCFVFYLIELIDPIENSKVIRKIVQLLQNNVKLAVNGISSNDFEKILHSVNEGLCRLTEISDNSWLGRLNAVIGLVNDNEIAISQTGNITGYIFRHNKISTMTERNSAENVPHPMKTFSDITAGELIESDKIIFGNDAFFNHISLDRIRNLAKEDNIRTESLALAAYLKKMHAFDSNAVLISASTNVEEEVKMDEEEVSEMIFIDRTTDNWRIFKEKFLFPTYEVIKKYSIIIYRLLAHHSKNLAQKSSQEWRDKYGPKTKELLQKSGASIEKAWTESQRKRPQIEIEGQSDLKGMKIRAIPYTNLTVHGIKRAFKKITPYFSHLSVLWKKENRKYLYIVLIIIALGIAYSKIAENNKNRAERTKAVLVANALEKAEALYKQAVDDLALGRPTGETELYDALVLAKQAQDAPANQEAAIKLGRQIQSQIDERIKAVRFYDIAGATLADNIKSTALVGQDIYGINTDGKIYTLDTRDNSSKLVGSISKDAGNAIYLSYASGLNKIIILTDKQKLLGFDLTSRTIEELKIADSSAWEDAIAIGSYTTNLYLLGSEAGVLWKHTAASTGYNKGTKYADTAKVSIRGAVDLAVDGNLFVLSNDGKLYKFVKGAYETDFTLSGIPAPDDKILIPARVITSDEMNSIFILDKKANRVIKFDKSGAFSNQYLFDGVTVDDFVVNTKLQKIWAISEGKVYEGNL